jgi:hypothetical protein
VHGQRSPPRCSPPVAGPLGAAPLGAPRYGPLVASAPHGGGRTRSAAAGERVVSILDRFAMPRCSSRSLPTSTSAVRDRAERPARTSGLRVGQPAWGLVSDSLGLVRTMRLPWWSRPRRRGRRVRLDPLALGMARGWAAPSRCAYPAGSSTSVTHRAGGAPSAELTRSCRSGPRHRPGLRGGGRGAAVHVAGGLRGHGWLRWRCRWHCASSTSPRAPGPPQPMAPFLAVARSRTALFVLGLAFVEGGVLLGVLTLLPSAIEAAGARPPSPEASRPSTASPSSSSRPGWAGCPGACTRRG